ncbi:MAG: hypothetical protein H8E55_24225 [Pelagibacterales bacterium]|nr:hypothetical protein [Pelagibacterales bacterium]
MKDLEILLFKLNYKLDLLISLQNKELKDEFKTDIGIGIKMDNIDKRYSKYKPPNKSSSEIFEYAVHI